MIDFLAKEPALGYYYQLRYGLYLLLRADLESDLEMSIEHLDDLLFSTGDTTQIIQLKHHLKQATNLTDSSADLWKTLRIWSELIKNDQINLEKSCFFLVTTSAVGGSSVISELRKNSEERDCEEVRRKLDAIALSSSNAANKSAYASYNLLRPEEKLELIKKIVIQDSSPIIDGLENKIIDSLKYSALPQHLSPFVQRLEGWWFEKSINILLGKEKVIKASDLRSKIATIRDSFRTDNLPIDFDQPIDIEDEHAEKDNRRFVQQLRLVECGKESVKVAMSDYYRSFEQRSRWVRESLATPEENDKFERRLFDYWKAKFALLVDGLTDRKQETLKREGRQFYEKNYVENPPSIKFRERVEEEFLFRGGSHHLADGGKIGWHPEFNKEVGE